MTDNTKTTYDLLRPILPGLLSKRFGLKNYNVLEQDNLVQTSVLVSGDTEESVTRRVRIIVDLLATNPAFSDGDTLELVIHNQGVCPPAEQIERSDFPRLMHWIACARYGKTYRDSRQFQRSMLILIRAKTRG